MASSNLAVTGDPVADSFLSGASAPETPEAPVSTGDAIADQFLASDNTAPPVEPATKTPIKRGIFGLPYIDPKSVQVPHTAPKPTGADSPMGIVADAALQGAAAIPLEVAAGVIGLASLPWGAETASRNISNVRNLIPRPNTDPRLQGPAAAAVQEGLESPINPLNLPSNAGKGVGWALNKAGVPEEISAPIGQATGDLSQLALAAKGAQALPEAEGGATEATTAPADFGYTNKSGGAAAANTDLSVLSPETRAAVEHARTQGPVNSEVLANHLEAESLPLPPGESPIRLTAGRATGDVQQFSDERNMRGDPATQGVLANLEAENNRKLVASMDEIRGNATPSVVQRNNLEHGQQAITDIKTEQNQRMDQIAANYKALADANKGVIPIDGPSFVKNARATLEGEGRDMYLPSTVEQILSRIEKSNGMPYQQFEQYRTALAEEARSAPNGNVGRAVSLVRDQLESLPMTGANAGLKALADKARSSAREMFQARESNPAYDAVFNDNVPKVNGRHNLETPSPLADTFMQRYVTGNGAGASRANILNLRTLMSDHAEFHDAVEGATLNTLRNAAGISDQGGGFNAASYNRARAALEPKIDALVRPETADVTQRLGNVARRLNEQPRGSFVNNSATAIAQQRLQHQEAGLGFGADLAHLGAHAAASAFGPAAGVANAAMGAAMRGRALRRAQALQAEIDAEKLNFAQEATAPGAGLNYQIK